MSAPSPRKRSKKLNPVRCHREDERARRRGISEGFQRLQRYLPPSSKRRARVEVLSEIREVVWEMWRNDEVLSLHRQGMLSKAFVKLQRHVVMKRERLKELQNLESMEPGPSTAVEDQPYLPLDPIIHHIPLPRPVPVHPTKAEIVAEDMTIQTKPEECDIIEEELSAEQFYKLFQNHEMIVPGDERGMDNPVEEIEMEEDEETEESEDGDEPPALTSVPLPVPPGYLPSFSGHLPNMLSNMLPNFRPDNSIVCPSAQFPATIPPTHSVASPTYPKFQLPPSLAMSYANQWAYESVAATATLNTDFGQLCRPDEPSTGEPSNVDVVN